MVRPPGPSLPKLATRGEHSPTLDVPDTGDKDGVEEVTGMEGGDNNLPKWAKKGLEK